MKSGILDGQTKSNAGKIRQMVSDERHCTPAMADSDRMPRLLHIAHEMGGPLNVVLGRMEYLLGRAADRETARGLKAIMSQAEQLVALRQQLLDEACAVRPIADPGTPVSIERGLCEA
jgi:K+-sensing histidine kinase KdpD